MNRSTVAGMKLHRAFLLLALAGCPNSALNESKVAANAGSKAAGQKQFETAITEYQKATEKYHDNHVAWYGLGGSFAGKCSTSIACDDWSKAVDAFANAVQINNDDAMYHMWYGIALYEKAVSTARQDQAHKENKKPEEIAVDLTAVNFEKPLQQLQEAAKINADLWRAHYYLGRIYREVDKPKDAADEFSKALRGNPREWAPYVALAELYRKWDYTDECIKVASQGTVNIPGTNEVSEIWYVLGMGYDDKRMDDKAIEAFDKAIESKKDNHKAKFQRGQAYFRKGDYTHAKRDLEDFSKTGGASLEFAKQQASKMLMDIAAKSAMENKPPEQKQSPEEMVKNKGKGGPAPKKK